MEPQAGNLLNWRKVSRSPSFCFVTVINLLLAPDSDHQRPAKRPRLSDFRNPSDKVSSLTLRDRKKAGDILRAISSVELPSGGGLEHAQELQRMLMLNIKAEIQAVDSYGDLSTWLDDNLCARMHAD